ncbi:VOC family protein [Streptomyces sp. TLI_171]|uniref:VOC family protein n=1 Tax=Streptomyces sp. TLI_171 TaxID=1938859 RepID=UPI000C3AEEBA|nr:VOC family protein [Streptomyces sp. TLI_171]RKE19181.1 extradiol dioxygenase family protein [Streptomyces sp. TLI_171]
MAMLADAPLLAVIPVTDLGRAKQYYRDTLGLTLARESEEEVTFRSGSTEFGMYETPYGGQAGHTLASWKVADLDAEMTELRARGVVFEEYDLPGLKTLDGVAENDGMRAAWFKDPDGNVLCVNEVREG